MKPDPKQILKATLDAFPLSEEEKQLITDQSTVRQYKKGSFLLREGEVAEECYFILKGCVREFFYKDGEDRSIGFYVEGDPVNSFTSATSKTPSKSSFVCVEDCVLSISNDDFESHMCSIIPRLESIIRQEVEKNTGEAQDKLARFITSSPEERYQDLLENRPDLLNRIPQHQIASFIGVTPESLSRIRKRMMNKA